MQVLKFGGTSVGCAENIEKVAKIVSDALNKDKTVVVASALGGITDKLIEIGNTAAYTKLKGKEGQQQYELLITELENRHNTIIEELIPVDYRRTINESVAELFSDLRNICNGIYKLKELSFNTLDLVMSFGELLSTKIITAKFSSMGINCRWVDSRDLIKTYFAISQNIVDRDKTYSNIGDYFNNVSGKLFVLPGFIASDENGRTTTLGRGGSDYTASLIAAGAGARILEIWTDVNGMMTADPRIVPEAKTIEHISYKEALELSHFGAKVVYPPTIQPVVKIGIPISVKNTFAPAGAGTLIESNPPESENNIKGISGSDKLAILSMEGSGMVGIPGYSSRFFDVLTKNEINIILITQASSVHTMLVAIDEKDAAKAKKAVDDFFAYEIRLGKIEPLVVEKGFSIISLVGDNMKNQSGASGRMFEALGRIGITIRAIAQGSSERNVSAVIKTEDVNEAVKAIHDEFFSHAERTINLFIAGYGNVGKELVNIIGEQRRQLLQTKNIDMRICGLCNSKKMVFNKSGIDPSIIADAIGKGERNDIYTFVNNMEKMNYNDTVFVDCTTDTSVAGLYTDILSKNCHVVAANKIANSSGYHIYEKIRKTAAAKRVKFIYNTNVGAALPIIATLQQMVASGDEVVKIEAMVSGSLNYIFSEYCSAKCHDKSFYKIVEEAAGLGYTEPDPRVDLAGTDVLRKAVILAREIGYKTERNEVSIGKFLPTECEKGSVKDFYEQMKKDENYFNELRQTAAEEGAKLRYIAVIENGHVAINLKKIDKLHPFYNLEGTNAAVSITSKLYPSPIIICGAGAGGRVTAGGVFGGILSII